MKALRPLKNGKKSCILLIHCFFSLGKRGLDFLLKPLVVVPWGKVESQLLGSLEDHTFGEAEMEDFTKEFDLVEGMMSTPLKKEMMSSSTGYHQVRGKNNMTDEN